MKNRKKKIIIIAIIVFISLIFISYRKARNKADEIMKPFLENEFYYYGTSFYPVQYLETNNGILKWWGPSWVISYDHKTFMMVGPLSIRINLFGKITETVPGNLREKIRPDILKLKKKTTDTIE